jgi:hypothetical protein
MIQPLKNFNMPFYSLNSNIGRYGTVPFRLDNFWTLEIGLWRRDWKLGDFWAIGRFLDFPISTVVIYLIKDWRLDEFWAIGRDFW